MGERKSWICEVDDKGVVTFPEELLELLNWRENDDINFDILPDDTLILTKVEPDESKVTQGKSDPTNGN